MQNSNQGEAQMNSVLAAEILNQIQRQEGKPFAVFDFDNTCQFNDIGEATFYYLCRHKLFKDFSLLGEGGDMNTYHERLLQTYHKLYGEKKIKEAYSLNAKMFSGFTPEEAEVVVHATIQEEGEELGETELYGVKIAHGLAPRPQTLAIMDFLKSRGVKIWMVSASAEVAVKVAMKHFNIVTDGLIGVKLVLKDGVYTSEFEMPISVIEGKVECMKKFISATQAPLLVIDDSTTGLPILETAVIKVVVNRNNELARIAKDKNWFLI
jgi:phosphoserine phosphatase